MHSIPNTILPEYPQNAYSENTEDVCLYNNSCPMKHSRMHAFCIFKCKLSLVIDYCLFCGVNNYIQCYVWFRDDGKKAH